MIHFTFYKIGDALENLLKTLKFPAKLDATYQEFSERKLVSLFLKASL